MMRRVIIITEGKLLKTNNFFGGGGCLEFIFDLFNKKTENMILPTPVTTVLRTDSTGTRTLLCPCTPNGVLEYYDTSTLH